MQVCVQGLWHLGSVTAACLASVGHDVIGLDIDPTTIDGLVEGRVPLFEPGLDALVKSGIANKNLRFLASPAEAVASAAVLWVAFDTPVDEDDQADVEFVHTQIKKVLPLLAKGAIVLVSSQMPVGSIRKLEDFARLSLPKKQLSFACIPENLRLGKAIDVFLKPDRIVVGIRNYKSRATLERLLLPITDKIEWMSIESAEMTKHAINSFLATSVTFANEIAAICELVGADAKEVERGLKTEERIGPRAYLSPGGPFAGGTLARDIEFLGKASSVKNLVTPLLSSVRPSNDEHKNWVRRKLLAQFGKLKDVTIAIWGLTYKPGTDTLRRSPAVELCDWLLEQGAFVHVHDPAVEHLPESWVGRQVFNHKVALEALAEADVLVIGTECPEFCDKARELTSVAKSHLVVIDANRHLEMPLANSDIKYIAVGMPSSRRNK